MGQYKILHQPQDDGVPKIRTGNTRIPSFRMPNSLFAEMRFIGESIGLSDSEFIRFAIANQILAIKSGNIKTFLSKEYMDKVIEEATQEMFNDVREKLKDKGVNIVEVE